MRANNLAVHKKNLKKYRLLLFWPLSLTLSWVTALYPEQIEKYYALSFSRIVNQALSLVTGVFPFSLAEVSICFLVIALAIVFIRFLVIKFINKRRQQQSRVQSSLFRNASNKKEGLFYFFYQLLIFGGVLYFTFMLIWGLNYNRMSFAEIAGLPSAEVTVSENELTELCDKLLTKANHLRTNLNEDERGVMKASGGFEEISRTAPKAFANATALYPEFGGNYGKPKHVLLSKLMSYTGITGIYFPFTSEANVNVDIPDCMLPATTCHEMAHQRGFAREDESNYIAWVTCNSSDNPEFQYSGTILALNHSLNALFKISPETVRTLQKKYSSGVRRDLAELSQYWEKYEGKVEEVASDINDAYLKSNRQKDGVQSYGRMVDLLLAEQKAEPSKNFL